MQDLDVLASQAETRGAPTRKLTTLYVLPQMRLMAREETRPFSKCTELALPPVYETSNSNYFEIRTSVPMNPMKAFPLLCLHLPRSVGLGADLEDGDGFSDPDDVRLADIGLSLSLNSNRYCRRSTRVVRGGNDFFQTTELLFSDHGVHCLDQTI